MFTIINIATIKYFKLYGDIMHYGGRKMRWYVGAMFERERSMAAALGIIHDVLYTGVNILFANTLISIMKTC